MHPIVQPIETCHTPESLAEQLQGEPGVVLLRSALFESHQARYSFVTTRPFLTFRSFGSRCECRMSGDECRGNSDRTGSPLILFGNPWQVLESLLSRYELLDEMDLPFPLGGCFGYWGYDLKNFVEPKLPRRASNDLELPDCQVGFYDSLVAFDHQLGKTWIISTGLGADGSRSDKRARTQADFWRQSLERSASERHDQKAPHDTLSPRGTSEERAGERGTTMLQPGKYETPLPGPLATSSWGEGIAFADIKGADKLRPLEDAFGNSPHFPHDFDIPTLHHSISSTLSPSEFVGRVERIQSYIRRGDIYQANLSHRLGVRSPGSAWDLFRRLTAVSPTPFSAYLDCGESQIASSSPELFLRLSGNHVQTRPIKGTRPRSPDPLRDAQLAYELQTSPKEMAELLMITDLLRNDLGRVCEYGSVQVPDLVRLERFQQVQHLVSTVEGRLRWPDLTHLAVLASCFPGGSVTGAPKIRAMEIIDELEPVSRGPYTGALGYLGFNRESQLSIIIRAAICKDGAAWFHAGAGIVADSNPAAEYEETLAKARGFLEAISLRSPHSARQHSSTTTLH